MNAAFLAMKLERLSGRTTEEMRNNEPGYLE